MPAEQCECCSGGIIREFRHNLGDPHPNVAQCEEDASPPYTLEFPRSTERQIELDGAIHFHVQGWASVDHAIAGDFCFSLEWAEPQPL